MNDVAVIIPIYKVYKYLHQAISSVCNQTYPIREICIVDDGSNEVEITDIVNSFNDSRIKIICFSKNRGISAARNAGVLNTESAFVSFLDSDDYWATDKIQKQIATILNSTADIACSSIVFHEDHKSPKLHVVSIPDNPLDTLFSELFFISPSTLFLSREKFNSIGGFDEDLRFGEDWDFLVRASLLRVTFVSVASLTHMRVHSKSMSISYFPLRDVQRLRKKLLQIKYEDKRVNTLMIAFSFSAMARWMHGKHSKWLEFYLLGLAGITNPRIIFNGHFRGNVMSSLINWSRINV